MSDIEYMPSNRETAIAAQLNAHKELDAIYARIREDNLRNIGGSALESCINSANRLKPDLDMLKDFSLHILPRTKSDKSTVVDTLEDAIGVRSRALEVDMSDYGYRAVAYLIGIRHIADDYSQLLCVSSSSDITKKDGDSREIPGLPLLITTRTPLVASYEQLVREFEHTSFTQQELKTIYSINDRTFTFRFGNGMLMKANVSIGQPHKLQQMTPEYVLRSGLMPYKIEGIDPNDAAMDTFDFGNFNIERGMADLAFMFNKGDEFKRILEERLVKETTVE